MLNTPTRLHRIYKGAQNLINFLTTIFNTHHHLFDAPISQSNWIFHQLKWAAVVPQTVIRPRHLGSRNDRILGELGKVDAAIIGPLLEPEQYKILQLRQLASYVFEYRGPLTLIVKGSIMEGQRM
ncbi:hypothetical protein N7G274_005842 [Stereocaulon virgatum]|uniref:Uncharacterized protein n=1 Tax=Stereocaulon virgatum TaxID=373712 RepID=A0ABR4A8M2_9LECA